MSFAIRNAPGAAPDSLRSIAFAPSAKPKAAAVLSSIRAIAAPAISLDLRASSGPMPSLSSAKPSGRSRLSETVIATVSGPADAMLTRVEPWMAWVSG